MILAHLPQLLAHCSLQINNHGTVESQQRSENRFASDIYRKLDNYGTNTEVYDDDSILIVDPDVR